MREAHLLSTRKPYFLAALKAMIDSRYSFKSTHVLTQQRHPYKSPATEVHTGNKPTTEECDLGLQLDIKSHHFLHTVISTNTNNTTTGLPQSFRWTKTTHSGSHHDARIFGLTHSNQKPYITPCLHQSLAKQKAQT